MKSAMITLTAALLSWGAQALELTKVREVTAQGQLVSVLQDTFNRSLYTFDPDRAGSSACSAKCAEVWPPYLLSEKEAAQLALPLSSIKRATGTIQLVHNGKPVYTYFEDRTANDVKGDGIGNVWHIIPVAQ